MGVRLSQRGEREEKVSVLEGLIMLGFPVCYCFIPTAISV